MTLSVRFPPAAPDGFASQVRADVRRFFEERGLSDKADARMVLRAVLMLAILFVPYGLLLGGVVTSWAALGLCVAMGVGFAGVGLAVAHDAIHGAWSSRTWVNRLVGFSFDLIGGNAYFWRLTHNRIHHTWTNVPGVDEDIAVSPWLRMSPATPHRPIHRRQHWFALPLYSLSTLNWIFLKDYKHLALRRFGPYEDVKHPGWVLPAVLGGKLSHYVWTILVPVLVLHPPVWGFLLGFLLMHLTAGAIVGITFELAHVVEDTTFPALSSDGKLPEEWHVHQMRTTSDFARSNRWLSHYMGGLNYQVEHHLFPQVCSVHYPAIAPIVEACARRHGVPYNAQPTVGRAIGSHLRALRRLGAAPLPQGEGARPEGALAIPR